MNRKKRVIIELICLSIFIAVALFQTYLLTTHVLNPYIVPFKRSFKSELTSILGNLAVLGFIVALIFIFIRRPYRRIYTMGIFDIILGIVMYGCRVYTRYYSSFFSFRTLSIFKNPAADLGMNIVIQVFEEFFTTGIFLVFIPSILMIIYALVFKNKHDLKEKSSTEYAKYKAGGAIISVCISFAMILNFKASSKKYWPYNNDLAMYGCQTAGAYNYYIYELCGVNFNYKDKKVFKESDVTVEIKKYDKNDLDYINFLDTTNSNSRVYEGLFEGKNIEIIQLESVNSFAVDLKIDGEYLMPNIQRIINDENSFNFTNFYSCVGQGKTADAELSVLTGVNPSGYTTLHWDYKNGNYDFDSLPELFKEKYNGNAYSFHGDVEGFYNREIVHEEMFGFDEYLSKEDYLLNHKNIKEDPSSYVNGWVDDEVVLNWVDEVKESSTSPYLMYAIMTVSHTPFTGNPFEDKLHDKLKYKNDMLYKYLAYMVYVDDYLGRVYEKMKNDTNTVYIMYGDHGSYLSEKELRELYGKQSNIELLEHQMKVPCIIFDASGKLNEATKNNMESNLVRSEIDIYTTLVDLFSLDYKGVRLGVNALSNELTFAYDANTFTIITDNYINYVKNGDFKLYNDISEIDMNKQIDEIKRYKQLVDAAKEYCLFKGGNK